MTPPISSTRDYYAELTTVQVENMDFILTTLATGKLYKISRTSKQLKEKGESLGTVHPLRFIHQLATVHSVALIKIHGLRQSCLTKEVWAQFWEPLKRSLIKEHKAGGIREDHAKHLADEADLHHATVIPHVTACKWDLLIEHIVKTKTNL